MMPEPMTTVVICTYNRLPWLRRCLTAIFEQTPLPDEVIVVDGPSTDGTDEFLSEMEAKGRIQSCPSIQTGRNIIGQESWLEGCQRRVDMFCG